MTTPARKATLADVARLAGTSTAVVSYVVNDGPRRVAPATRARVEEAIRLLGYRRNPFAGVLGGGRSDLIGLLVPDSANAFFGDLARCIEYEGRRRGLLTLFGNTGFDAGLAAEYSAAFSDLRPRGVFVTRGERRADHDDTPRVFLMWPPPEPGPPAVSFDELGGGVTAVEHLLDHGYEDVHCLSGSDRDGPSPDREEGWRRAMEAAGLETAGRLHLFSFNRMRVHAEIRRLLCAPRRPRAIFATTDEQALATVRVAQSLGLRIPEDVAVVGFDGSGEARLGNVVLTTLSLPLERLARRGFDALERFARSGEAVVETLEGELSIGETCGCPYPSGEPASADAYEHGVSA